MTPGAEDSADAARAARRARRERLRAAHPDTGGSADAFRALVAQLSSPRHEAPLRVVVRRDRNGLLGAVDNLVRQAQAARLRRRRTRVD